MKLDTLPVRSRYSELGQSQASTTSPPLPAPLDHSCILTKYQQVLIDSNNKRINYLPGFCTAVSCILVIETPVPSEDHIDKDPHNKTHTFILTIYLCNPPPPPLPAIIYPTMNTTTHQIRLGRPGLWKPEGLSTTEHHHDLKVV